MLAVADSRTAPEPRAKEPTVDTPTEFPTLRYDRLCRTPYSEAYLLSEDDLPLGRVDLHFGASVVHAVLMLERDVTDEPLHALLERIDADLVWTADRPRDDFLATVYRGQEIGTYSDEPEGEEIEDAGP